MKNSEGITWMRLTTTETPYGIDYPKELKNFSQAAKWTSAKIDAPDWKKDEYFAQFQAWAED